MASPDSEGGTETQKLTCFVIGPIGDRHAEHGSDERMTYEAAAAVWEELIHPACAACGLDPVRADGLARAGEITEQIFLRLRDDDVVIADLSGANPNVMYELGLRHTRDKLTVQVGEYGRLPFDVNVIRTIIFSRSPYGLAQARDELTLMLRLGLEGQYDAVSATRIWNEDAFTPVEEDAHEAPRPAVSDEEDEEEEDVPGFLDLVAEGEEQADKMASASTQIGDAVTAMGKLAESFVARMEQSDAQGRGMKGRLAVITRFASGLDEIADDLEAIVAQYEAAMAAVSSGNLAIIGRLEDDPTQLDEGMEWAMMIRRLAHTARDALSDLNSMVGLMAENARHARVLRPPTRRVTDALGRFAAATSSVDEWDRRLQALGVPTPAEDWEPSDQEDTSTP